MPSKIMALLCAQTDEYRRILELHPKALNAAISPVYTTQAHSKTLPSFLQGQEFDFGMTAPRNDPVSISLGSGIPCGVAPRAGKSPPLAPHKLTDAAKHS